MHPSKETLLFMVFVTFVHAAVAGPDGAAIPDTVHAGNIAVLNLEARGGLTETEILTVSDRLRGELINTGKYNVLERGQMTAILEEQGFQQSESCSDASCIAEVGELLAVHRMVGGAIGKVGRAYSINLKIIDVQSGRIERQISKDIRCGKEELVSVHMRDIAREMTGMEKIGKPLHKRWLFWTSLAALAGGGTALYFFAGTDRDEPPAGEEQKTGAVTIEWSE